MSPLQRVLLATAIVVVDAVVFFLPLASFFLAYVILTNPPWVRDFLATLDEPDR